jgi:hypothetical protein
VLLLSLVCRLSIVHHRLPWESRKCARRQTSAPAPSRAANSFRRYIPGRSVQFFERHVRQQRAEQLQEIDRFFASVLFTIHCVVLQWPMLKMYLPVLCLPADHIQPYKLRSNGSTVVHCNRWVGLPILITLEYRTLTLPLALPVPETYRRRWCRLELVWLSSMWVLVFNNAK